MIARDVVRLLATRFDLLNHGLTPMRPRFRKTKLGYAT